MQNSNSKTSQTKKQSKFEKLLGKAQEKNSFMWDCLVDIVFSKEHMCLELDQFALCGQDESSLYQMGTGLFVHCKMKYRTTLN